jgi:hypothetical protein
MNETCLLDANEARKTDPSVEVALSRNIRLLLLVACLLGMLFPFAVNFTRHNLTTDMRSFKTHWNRSELNSSQVHTSLHADLLQRQFDIVLSYYNEEIPFVARFILYLRNVSTIQRLNPRFIVYNKNALMNISYLKDALLADTVITLPNLGREGGTYLTHIINNYDTLANHTLFSQAGVDGITDTGLSDWFSDRLLQQFNSAVGYMPLVADSWISAYACNDHPPPGHLPKLTELWRMLEYPMCPGGARAVREHRKI